MNKQRRNEIAEAIERIEGIQLLLDTVMQDEQNALDNMPESIQKSERGERMDESIGFIQSAIDIMQKAIRNLQIAKEYDMEYALPDTDTIYRKVEEAFENRFYSLHDLIHHNTYTKDMASSFGCRATRLLEEKIKDAQTMLLRKIYG